MSNADDPLSQRLRPFGIVFEKSLNDLIRGIRSTKDSGARESYLRRAVSDCRDEVRSPDMDTKTMAVLKLAYLEMYDYDMSWASFHVLEVMASPKFQQKRVGYLAAMQTFRVDTDILLLTTNLFKKDLASSRYLDVSVSLSGIASMVTPTLAQDLSDDVLKMLTHSRPYIRKKAVLALYKIFLQYPEAFKIAFPRLKERLNDSDGSVVSATVNVICELSKQSSTKSLIQLAPQLYELLTTSKNNWMIIKILKLFSLLAPREPRLKQKLLPPILQLMKSTSAMSLLYECINCIISSGMLDENDYELAGECVGKLRLLVEESDQNLKYVGLLALTKIVRLYPQFLAGQQTVILNCMDDRDLTIREQVLSLLSATVDENNLFSIITKLMKQLHQDANDDTLASLNAVRRYRFLVIRKIIELCSFKTYQLIPDFEWYISILVELVLNCPVESQLESSAEKSVGALIGEQFRDIATRVKAVRPILIASACGLLLDNASFIAQSVPSVFFGLIWTLGEYSQHLVDPVETLNIVFYLNSTLSKSHVDDLNDEYSKLSAIFIQAAMKLYTAFAGRKTVQWSANRSASVKEVTVKLENFLQTRISAVSFEVQERAVGFFELLKVVEQGIEEHDANDLDTPPLLLTVAMPSLFNEYEIIPVAKGAQRRVPIPAELDLDKPICAVSLSLSDSDEFYDNEDYENDVFLEDSVSPFQVMKEQKMILENDNAELEIGSQREERERRQQNDPFYLGTKNTVSTESEMSSPISLTPNEKLTFDGPRRPRKADIEILQDEDIGEEPNGADRQNPVIPVKKKKAVLRVESRLKNLSLSDEEDTAEAASEIERIRDELSNISGNTVEVVHKKLKKKSVKKKDDGSGKKKKKKKKSSENETVRASSGTPETETSVSKSE